MKQLKLQANDGATLHLYSWDDTAKPRAVVQMVHGASEYMGRYDFFAKYLNKHGFIVIGNDLRGHGLTASQENLPFGLFASDNGWNTLVDDLVTVNNYIKQQWTDLPVVMFGHSMGSFLVRTFAIMHGDLIKMMILSGTAQNSRLALRAGMRIARVHQSKYGPAFIDNKLHNLAFKPLNRRFRHESNTGHAWLTKDIAVQEALVNDPLFGHVFTASAFKDMFSGILFNRKRKNIIKMPKNLLIYLIAGENDSVTKFGKYVKAVYKQFRRANYDVVMDLIPHARHEPFNDIERQVAMEDIRLFINNSLVKSTIEPALRY